LATDLNEGLLDMLSRFAVMFSACAFALSTAAIAAAPASGTVLNGMLAQSFSTKSAYVGQAVELVNVNSTDNSIRGAKLYGHVSVATKAGQGRNAELNFTFTKLVLANGTSYAVVGKTTGGQAQPESQAGKKIVGTGGGMLVGNAIGKTVFQGNNGGAVGAVAGFMLASNNKADFTMPQGASVAFQISNAKSSN
jgi:hypothetical protein